MKQDKQFDEKETYSISTTFSSNQSKGQNKEQNSEKSKIVKYTPQQLILCIFQKTTNQEEEQDLSFMEQDNQHLIDYILDHQHYLIDGGKKLYITLREEYEDNPQQQDQNPPFFQILNKIIEKMQNGQNTTYIFQNCCISGIHLLQNLNKIQEEIYQQEIQQQQYDQYKFLNENNKITLINIISINSQNTVLLQKQFSKILQSFTFIINPNNNFDFSDIFMDLKKNHQQKGLVIQNQYFLPINFKNQEQNIKVTSEIENIYKYFLKAKIIQFKPKIIILGIEIDNSFEIDSYYLQKIIYQLNKISQNQLIILPIRKSTNQEQYWQTIIQCINAINTYNKTKKNHIQDNNRMRAKNQLACIEYMSQTNKEKEFYKKQFKSLNLLQKFEESIEKKQNTQEIFKFPIINQKNVIEYVILENSENGQQIYIDSETKYYVSYFQENTENKLTISIIKNQQLYLGEINLQEIEIKNENQKKIILEEIVIFQDNPNSSFLLDKQKFYQITLDINKMNQFIGTVIIYNFKQNQNKIYKFSDQNNNEIQGHIKGFTIIKHSDTSFSLLSGCMDGELYQQIGVKLDLVEQNSLKINQYQKQNNKLPKGYDYPLIVKFEPNNEQRNNSNKYLYFESQTKYQAQPFSPEIHQINFSHNQQNISCKSEILTNITNIQLFQKYSKLFRSDKINLKYQKCTSNIIVIDLVVFEKSFERNNLKDFNDNNKDIVLSKQPLQNYLHFQCCYYIKSFQTQLKFNLNINSILLKSNNDTLNQKCLYNNWLEDQNFQHIFLFNKSQHIYLLYYLKDKSGQYFKKKFTFYCDENPKDFIPYDEIMINDYYNNVIWIVRQYYDRNYPYLVIYNCHWMRLQGIKDDDVNILVKVKIDKIFELNINSQQFNLIGLEVRKTDNMLLICSSTFICQIPIQKIRNYNCNQQNIQKQMIDEKSLYQIFYTQLPICHNSQTILLNLNDTTIAFFYQYCTINCLDEKQTFYQIEIKAQIWSQKKQLDPNIENYLILSNSNDNMNYYNQNEIQDDKVLIKQSFNYEAKNTLILAKLISIEFKGQFFQYWIFFEQEFSQFQVIEYYFTSKCNSIIKKRIINLQQSQGTIQFLKSMSTNKYETLILYENSTQLIQSECNQDIFLNEETEQDLGQQKVHNYLDKQEYLLN